MFGWLRRLTESDRRILRRIQRDQSDLADHVTLLSERLIRLDARLRKRASRGLEQLADDGASDGVGPAALPSGAHDLPRLQSGEATAETVTYTKEQLRDFARARGILPHARQQA